MKFLPAARPSRRAGIVVAGVALVALLGSSAAWALTTKTVTLSVDGKTSKVHLHGDTVADVLSAEGLKAGAHDLLAPAASAHVIDGDTVALRRGRELKLVVDGVSRSVWVTAGSVDEALQQIGLRTDGAVLSASRSRAIGLDGLSLDVRLPKQVSISVDGTTSPVTSAAATVGDLLTEVAVTLRPSDTASVDLSSPLTDGLVVTVTRHDTTQVLEDVPVPFAVVQSADPGADVGTQRVTTPGRTGTEHRTWSVDLTNGVETGRTLVSAQRTAEPVAQQVAVGSKPKPKPVPVAAAPGPVPAGSGSGLNWGALAACESGGNPRAVGGGGLYFGLYQFSLSTWASVGGSGNPVNASPAEQTARAQALYARTGPSSWPVCGRNL